MTRARRIGGETSGNGVGGDSSGNGFTSAGQWATVATALALCVALVLAPGCMAIKKTIGKLSATHKAWCDAERESYAWAKKEVFARMDSLATDNPDIAEEWGRLQGKIAAAQLEATTACADTGPTTGSVGAVIADAAGFLSELYALFGAIGGVRDSGRAPVRCIEEKASMDRLLLEIESATGARSRAGSRALRGR